MLSPIIVSALCALGLLVAASLRRVPANHVYTFRRMDGHVRFVGSGTHWVMPIVERVAHKISLAGAAIAVDELLRDANRYRGVVYFQVLDPQRADVVIEDVESLIRDTTRRQFASAALPETADSRRQWLKQTLNAELGEHGLLIARVDLNTVG